MSQDLRTYRLKRVDEADNEAGKLAVTATVGPSSEKGMRGVQLTLMTPNGTAYGRVTEAQLHDLVGVLNLRVDDNLPYEATGWQASDVVVNREGEIE